MSWLSCYIVRGGASGIRPGGATTSLHGGAVCWGGVQEGAMLPPWLLAGFESLPSLPTSKLGLSGADSQMGGSVYVPRPCGSLLSELCCEAGSFSHHLNPHRFFRSEVLRLYFPVLVPWVFEVCLAFQLFLLVYLLANVGPPSSPDAATSLTHLGISTRRAQFDCG